MLPHPRKTNVSSQKSPFLTVKASLANVILEEVQRWLDIIALEDSAIVSQLSQPFPLRLPFAMFGDLSLY